MNCNYYVQENHDVKFSYRPVQSQAEKIVSHDGGSFCNLVSETLDVSVTQEGKPGQTHTAGSLPGFLEQLRSFLFYLIKASTPKCVYTHL